MTMKTALAAAVAVPLLAGVAHAQQESVIKIGTLQCDVSAGLGAVIASSRNMDCVYRPVRGRRETYSGTIRRFGLDIGVTTRGVLVWSVFAPGRGVQPGALAGEYIGASAEATVFAGLGANALVGGSDRSFALQPLSVQGQTGLSLAAGVGQLVLVSTRPRR
jgi:Protein of unknown function (DUF992)